MMMCTLRAEALDVSAHSAILMDGDSGQVLYEKNADEKSLIASTTKIMTALVTLEQADPEAVVEIPQAAVGIEGSSMYLKAGETLRVEDLLYGMMLSSGNDAAVALALFVGGSVEEFAALMNEKAAELGMTASRFANPNGLDSEENYATARDLAKLARVAMENEDFRKIVSTKSYLCEGHSMTNHNKLLWQYDGAVGVKTGYTKHAGRILVGSAERDGRRLISVTINAPSDWADHREMLDYGFSMYEKRWLLESGQIVGEIPVIAGRESTVPIIAGGNVEEYLLPNEEGEVTLQIPEFCYAPTEKGQEIGEIVVSVDGRQVGAVPALIGKSVEILPEEPGFWQKFINRFA